MRPTRALMVVAAGVLPLTLGGAAVPARAAQVPPAAALERAAAVLHVQEVRTLRLSGHGSDFLFGQAYDGHSPWPRFHLPRYVLEVDFEAGAVREERVRRQADGPPRGGGNQPIDQQRQVWAYRDGVAWNGEGRTASAAGLERDRRTAAEARLAWIWLTPHGFIRAALAGQPHVTPIVVHGKTKTTVAVTGPNRQTYTGTLDENGLVERIETWLSSPVLGDTQLEAVFDGYQTHNGVPVPSRIIHREGGYPILDVAVREVAVNPTLAIDVPAQVRAAVERQVPATPTALAPGVWHIPVGPRDRVVAVEFGDHVLVVEAPQGEPESIAALAQIRSTIPGKPIRYVVNTHIHFDHSGGLRAYAAEGAAIVTHLDNVAYYEQAWANPWTIRPDRLAASGRTARFVGVVGSRTFTDGARTLVVYHYAGNDHHPGMLMVHLPAERILIEADSFNPPDDPEVRPNAVPNLVHFYGAVKRLGLAVDLLVPTHGRLTTLDEAGRAIERFWAGPVE